MKVELIFHPIYELLNSIHAYSETTIYKKTELGTNWRKQATSRISKELAESLNTNKKKLFKFLYEYVLTRSFDKMPIEQILEELTNVDEQLVISDFCAKLKMKEDQMKPITETFHEAVGLVKRWNEEYFQYVDKTIITRLELDFKQKKDQLKKCAPNNVLPFIEKVTNGLVLNDFNDVKKVVLYPIYHSNPMIIYSIYEQIHFYGYPTEIILPEAEHEPAPRLMYRGMALTDKNRLKILRYLENKERSFTDIVQFIGLAKSTVHHHMVILRASGLVQIILSPDTSERFRLREKGLEEIYRSYHDYLFRASKKE